MESIYAKKTLNDYEIGQFALFTKTISASDVMLFAGISGDLDPLYLNREFGESTVYGSQLAHPMLVASMIGGAVFRLLKPDFYPVSRSFEVVKPFPVGETVTTRAVITEKDEEHHQIKLLLEAYNSAGELVVKETSTEQMEIRK